LTAYPNNCTSCAYLWTGGGTSSTNSACAPSTSGYTSYYTCTVTSGAGGCTATSNQASVLAVVPGVFATNTTWANFGDGMTWSDAVNYVPTASECSEAATFTTTYYDYSQWTRRVSKCGPAGKQRTCYYYSWQCVNSIGHILCPLPWSVPSYAQFSVLASSVSGPSLLAEWGYSGWLEGYNLANEDSQSRLWATDPNVRENTGDFLRVFVGDAAAFHDGRRYHGYQVRCVR
jgi:hypothetical protein